MICPPEHVLHAEDLLLDQHRHAMIPLEIHGRLISVVLLVSFVQLHTPYFVCTPAFLGLYRPPQDTHTMAPTIPRFEICR